MKSLGYAYFSLKLYVEDEFFLFISEKNQNFIEHVKNEIFKYAKNSAKDTNTKTRTNKLHSKKKSNSVFSNI